MKRQRGTVLILAMLIVALAATTAAVALKRQDQSLQRLEAARDAGQARWALVGGTHWARAILSQDARFSGEVDHAGELWATGLPPTAVEHGTVAGEIRDAQGRFNLANLLRGGKPSAPDIAALERLLALAGLAPRLAQAIAQAQPMREPAELARVPGLDAGALAKLAPLLALLPERTPLNVNTARPEVLAAAIEGLSLAEALVLARELEQRPVRSLAELRTRLQRPEVFLDDESLSVKTRYFLVEGRARFGVASVRLEALLERKGGALPAIVWQRTS